MSRKYFNRLGSIVLIIILLACLNFSESRNLSPLTKIPVPAKTNAGYSKLVYEGLEHIPSSNWIKSVLFNTGGNKLYTLNLENMSIDEYDRANRMLTRKLCFVPKPAPGWNYAKNMPMPSFEEKPVEACFSNDDKILWISLHNAGGIAAIPINSLQVLNKNNRSFSKQMYVFNTANNTSDTINVPFIRTGETPKVIVKTSDSKVLMVSNWHGGTLSVLKINDTLPPYAKKIADIKVGSFPRGIYVNNRSGKTYVAIMGGSSISVIDDKTWKVQKNISAESNPRHITADSTGRLFVSFTALSEIACIDSRSGRILFKSATGAKPRTIALSKNQKFLFVTCYEANSLDVFKINKGSFSRIYSINCTGKPVGIDLYEDAVKLEAWVCTYRENNLKIFSFLKAGLGSG